MASTVTVVVDVTGLWNRSHLESEVIKMLSFHHTKPSILVLNKVSVHFDEAFALCLTLFFFNFFELILL